MARHHTTQHDTDTPEPIPAFGAGSSSLERRRAQSAAPRSERRPASLETILEHGTEPIAGGHLIWKHASRNVRVDGKLQAIQRAVWERVNGQSLNGRFLLNHCAVQDCIAPNCYTASRYPHWWDYCRHMHTSTCGSGAACAGNREVSTCQP